MCGPAFSGKTTLAVAIVRARGYERIALDEINAERGLPPGGEGLPVEEWERTSAEAVRRLHAAMGRGAGVVLDDTCCYRFLRDRYRAVARTHGYRPTVVFLDVPERVLLERLAANRVARERPDVRDEIMAAHLASFEIPEADEEVLVFRAGDPISAWIERQLPRDGP